jgi:hypothetical protein
MDSFSHKRARIGEKSRLIFLPNSWWEYIDWAKEARVLVDPIPGGRFSPGMRRLLADVDWYITECVGRREYSLAPFVVESTTCRFREELEALLTANGQQAKVPFSLLGASTSLA